MSEDNNSNSFSEESMEFEYPYFKGINSYVISYNVETIISLIDKNVIELHPDFQRNYIWDIRRASKLIDSILNNLPIPNIFLGRFRDSEKLIVIDGQQRLKTIYFFIKGYFNDKNEIFRLKDTIHHKWEEKSFNELNNITQLKILNSIINATVLDNIDIRPGVIYELFYRLNTGGISLTAQEIRNCIFSGDFINILKRSNEIPHWREILGIKKRDTRMGDLELVLRFYSLYNDKYLNYRPEMKEWLDDTCSSEKASFKSSSDYEYFYSLFEKTTKLIYDEIGNDVFKGERKIFNRAIFDSVMVSIATGIEKGNIKGNLKSNFFLLLADKDFKSSIGNFPDRPHNIKSRINLARGYLLDE
jgi:uncharacterized protein with ParB-like and HNH nuclease domain